MNGAHGNTWYESTNLNTQTGEEIPIDSVITDFSNLSTILEAELQEKYPYLGFENEKTRCNTLLNRLPE